MHIRSYEEEVHATRGQKPAKTFSESTSLQSCTTSVNPVQGGDKSKQDKFHSLGPLKMGPIHLRKHIEHDAQLTQSFSIADHPKFAKNKTVEEQLVNKNVSFSYLRFVLFFIGRLGEQRFCTILGTQNFSVFILWAFENLVYTWFSSKNAHTLPISASTPNWFICYIPGFSAACFHPVLLPSN